VNSFYLKKQILAANMTAYFKNLLFLDGKKYLQKG